MGKDTLDGLEKATKENVSKGSKVNLNNLLRFRPNNVINDEDTTFEKEEEEPKSLLKTITPDIIKRDKDKEKQAILTGYHQIYEQQAIGANTLSKLVVPKVQTGLVELLLGEYEQFITQSGLTMEESHLRISDRNRIIKEVSLVTNNLSVLMETDILGKYQDRLNLIKDLNNNLDNIEIVRKITYSPTRITYYTDNGNYSFDSRRNSLFGGYIIQSVRVVTEDLNLDEILKGIDAKSKDIRTKNTNLFWLMLEPFLGRADDGKYLIMGTDYLKASMGYYKEIYKKKSMKKITKEIGDFKDDEYKALMKETHLDFQTMIKYINKHLSIPKTGICVSYPYFTLKASNVDFEFDFDKDEIDFTKFDSFLNLDREFIEFDSLEKMSNELKVTNQTKRMCSYLDNLIKFSSKMDLNGYILSMKDASDWDTMKRRYGKDIEKVNGEELYNLFINNYVEHYTDKELTEIDKNGDPSQKDETEKLREKRGNKIKSIFNNGYKNVEEFFKNLASFDFEMYQALSVNLPDMIDLNVDFKVKRVLSKLSELIENLNNFSDNHMPNDYMVAMHIIIGNNLPLSLIIEGFKEIEVNSNNGWLDKHPILSKYAKDSRLWLEEKQAEIRVSYTTLEDSFKEFLRIKKKSEEINRMFNRVKPTSLRDLDCIIDVGMPVDFSGIIIERLMNEPEIRQAVNDIELYPSPIIGKVTLMDYNKFRSIFVYLNKKGIQISNWLEILKIFVPTSPHPQALVRLVPEIQELVGLSEVYNELKQINELGKIRRVSPESSWDAVIKRTESNLPTLTAEELKINLLMSDIFTNHLGLMCAIDFTSLANYIVNTEFSEIQGSEIVKFVPLPQVVNKYFPIRRTIPRVRIRENLYRELKFAPPTLLAIKEILNTSKIYLTNNRDMDKIAELSETVSEYNKVIAELRDVDFTIEKGGYGTSLVELNNLMSRYSTLYKNMNSFSPLKNEFKKYTEFEEEDFFKVRKEMEEFADKYYNVNSSYKEELNKLDKLLNRVLDDLREEKTKKLETLMDLKSDKIDNLSRSDKDRINKIEWELKGIEKTSKEMYETEIAIHKQSGDYILDTQNFIIEYYNKDEVFKQIQTALQMLDLHYLRKTGVVANYIKTITDPLPDLIAAAYMSVILDYLIQLKDLYKESPFNSVKSTLEKIETLFPRLTFVLGLDNSLKLTKKDLKDAEEKLEYEFGELERSAEEIEEVQKFLDLLRKTPEDMRADMVKNYPNLDIINDRTYEDIVYPSTEDYSKMYPDFYHDDFSFAENMRLRLELGYTLRPEHLSDAKLMSIVHSFIIDEEFLKDFKFEK